MQIHNEYLQITRHFFGWVDEIPMLEDYDDAAHIIWKHWGISGHDLDAPIPKPAKNVSKHVLRLIPG